MCIIAIKRSAVHAKFACFAAKSQNGGRSDDVNNFACTFAMENYVLYEELPSCAQGCVHYKGRRRRSIHFVSIEKCDKARKEMVANSVRRNLFCK